MGGIDAGGPTAADDLTLVVRRFKRRQGDRYNADLIAHPATKAFLEAGMQLVTRGFSPTDEDRVELGADGLPGFQGLLTRKNIAAEAVKLASTATEGRFRNTWEYLSDYFADLVRYGLWSAHWAPHLVLVDRYLAIVDEREADLSRLAREIAKEDLGAVRERPVTMRFRYFIAAFADRDPDYQESLNKAQADILDRWSQLYQRILTSRNLSLRPGLHLDDVTRMLHGAMEGLSLQVITTPDGEPGSIDAGSLLGTMGLAMIAACIDTGDDGRSLEQVVADISGPRRVEDGR